jgi:hypothetical protein
MAQSGACERHARRGPDSSPSSSLLTARLPGLDDGRLRHALIQESLACERERHHLRDMQSLARRTLANLLAAAEAPVVISTTTRVVECQSTVPSDSGWSVGMR